MTFDPFNKDHKIYNPHPKTIAKACREIREKWTEDQKYKNLRSDWRPTRVETKLDVEHPKV